MAKPQATTRKCDWCYRSFTGWGFCFSWTATQWWGTTRKLVTLTRIMCPECFARFEVYLGAKAAVPAQSMGDVIIDQRKEVPAKPPTAGSQANGQTTGS